MLRCSFCHKSESDVRKLISSPSDYPRAHICDECVRVCATVVIGEFGPINEERNPQSRESLLGHPMAFDLIALVEQWITREASGREATEELNNLRACAKPMFVNPDA